MTDQREWVLTEESEALLEGWGRYGEVRQAWRDAFAAIERAAVARALTVDNVARALHGDIGRCYADDHRWGVPLCVNMAEALLAALTEDVP